MYLSRRSDEQKRFLAFSITQSRRSLRKSTTFFQLCKKIDRFGKELPAFMREMQYLCSAKLNRN